jgi:flagellum-specific ATP synthase
LLDEAMALYPQLEAFLQQDMHQCENYADSRNRLAVMLNA